MSAEKTRLHILPDIWSGNVMMIHEGRQIGELTPADAKKLGQVIIDTAEQAERLFNDHKRRAG